MDQAAEFGVSRRAVFLDRDGVLNVAVIRDGRPHPPRSLAELKITIDAPSALASLAASGFLLIGATNQPDVARGTQPRDVVEALNARIMSSLPLLDLLVCYHDSADDCSCRKPNPGLLIQAADKYSVDLSRSYMVGDRWSDIGAGYRAGCQTILIGNGYTEPQTFTPTCIVDSLSDAVRWILRNAGRTGESR